MDEPSRRRAERKSGSSSRSPSLSRRPSLKDKKVPGTIVKVKGKKSSASSSKKERWLLTRKTWRYMSDAVGNLLPESHRSGSGGSTSTVPGSLTAATAGTRRTSAGGTASASEFGTGASFSFQGHGSQSYVTDIPGGATAGPSTASRPKSIPTGFTQGGPSGGSGPGSKGSSTVTSPTYGGVISFPSHRPGVTPGPGPGKMFSSPQSPQQQQILIATDKFYPPSDDIPTLEQHFDAVCSREKRFLLWNRTKPKGPSGPALRELKKQHKDQKAKSGKQSSGHRGSAGSILDALQMRLQIGSGSGAAGNKENILAGEYYSPTTEEEDDYDEYDDPDEITVRERRKSSTASSTMSMMGSGQCWTQGSLTFFRPLSTLSSHGSESSYSMIVTSLGVTKICRNTGTQTDPFPEELLIRFRLQAVQEERQQQQQQNISQIFSDNQSDATTLESPMSPVRVDTAQKVSSPPPTTTASSPMSPTNSTDGGLGRASSGSGRESQEKLLETGSSTRPSISGQSESMATTKSGEGASTATTTTDKKSEESGYSSSISDTVMRYLRMVRKNSKADNKDTIDKFKTVNYDRSLRYIKSKNVTVEEALEHEKNKQAAQLQQKQEGEQASQVIAQSASSGAVTFEVATAAGITMSSSEAPTSPTSDQNLEKGFAQSDSSSFQKQDSSTEMPSLSGPTSPTSSVPPQVLPGSDISVRGETGGLASSATAVEQESKEKAQILNQRVLADSDIPPSSPPPPPTQSPPLSPSTLSVRRASQGPAFRPQQLAQEKPASVGIQAGESLVRFLKNLAPNPIARKMSDFSSSCCSSDSPAEAFSPRYSFATTAMSGSASDAEMLGAGGVQQAAIASMMALAAARGMRRPQHELMTGAAAAALPQTPSDVEGAAEFDDVFQGRRLSFLQKQSQQSGPLSSSWSSSATPTQTGESAIKKSSSVQQMSFGGELRGTAPVPTVPITTVSSSSSYSFSQLFHYKSLRGSRDQTAGGMSSSGTTSTPATPTTGSIGGSSGGLMKSFFGSGPFSSTFGLKRSALRKPTSTTSLTITTNTGSDSRGNAPPPTTSSSPNLLSLIQSGAASAGTGLTNLFSSRSGGGGSGSSVTSTSASRGGEFQQTLMSSSAASSSGELRAQKSSGIPLYPPLYSRSSLPIHGGGGKTTTTAGLVGGHHHHPHHHPHHAFVSSGHSGGSIFMAKGLTDFIFSHGSSSSSRKGSGSSARSTDLYLTPPGVMQKSKSSSSVLPLYGSSGSVSGAPGASTSTAHLRVSPSSSIGGSADAAGAAGGGSAGSTSEPAGAASLAAAAAAPTPTATTSSSGGSRLISKSKLFKSRSKSSTRPTTSSSGSPICTWSPQGRCKWKSVTGKVVTLEQTNVLSLSEVERMTLQDVALEKLRALNLGVEIKIPKEKVGGGQQKPKRRPYLLKKKALSTGFFESGSKREDAKESSGGGSGLVFGVPLSQCVANDRLRQMKSAAATSAALTLSTPDWEQQQPQSSHAQHKRSQNGSRNSVSSVFEMSKEDKDPLQTPSPSVPAIVTACINHLENYGLHTTGIFRVSTSLKRIRQLREDIDSGKEIVFGEDHSPHDVAALLKEFLRDLPEPLLSRDLYQAFLKTQKIRNRKLQLEAIQHLVQLLPVSNRDTLAALLKFFAKVVANSSETKSKTGEILPGNKMEGYSLATLIAPNILPCMPTEGAGVAGSAAAMDQNAALTKERRESIDLVNYMISNYSAIFDVSPELLHDVYLHLMDTNPEAIEGILRHRYSSAADDGADELETTSSVFEESEGGEGIDPDDTITATSNAAARIYRKREDILHEGAGKGGTSDEGRTRERTRTRREEAGSSAGAYSDAEKQGQSGGESDSSVGQRSTSRWFRRSRGDAKGRTSSDSGSEKMKVSSRKRESSLFETKRASSLDSVNIQEPLSTAPAQSMRISPRASAVITDIIPARPLSGSDQSLRVPEHLVNTRRQSSPVLESSGIITASLKIPVPVPLNIDDSDIPYIEDENSMEAGASAQPYHHHHIVQHHQSSQPTQHQSYFPYQQQQQQPTQKYQQPQQQQSQYPYPLHPPDVPSPMGGSDVAVVRCRSMSTDSSVPMKTTSSSVTTTPISSPARQPSSEVSSPASFSPPTSPSLYGTFPVEEMTARMLIGSAAASSSTPSTATALSSSPSMHQFHHHGAITMTTPSSSSSGYTYPTMSTISTATVSKDPYKETRSASSTPVTRPKVEKGGSGTGGLGSLGSGTASVSRTTVVSSPHLTQKPITTAPQGAIASLAVPTPKVGDLSSKSAPTSPQPPQFSSSLSVGTVPPTSSNLSIAPSQTVQGTTSQQTAPPPASTFFLPPGEPKGLGKETKGANIAGLIKSKTADFEKTTTSVKSSPSTSQVEPSESVSSGGTSTTPSPLSQSSSYHQIYSIAPKMRLRSQENVLLKQQFLLRQQQQHQQGEPGITRRERTSQKGSSEQSTTSSTSVTDDQHQSSASKEESSSHVQTGGRQLTRRRLVGSASSSSIIPSKPSGGSGGAGGGPTSQRLRSRDSENVTHSASASQVSAAPSQPASTSTASSGSSPSRWKRSEIIASRQQSQPPSDPETFV